MTPWSVGLLDVRRLYRVCTRVASYPSAGMSPGSIVSLVSLILPVASGGIFRWLEASMPPLIEMLTSPQGALMLTARASSLYLDTNRRTEVLGSGVRRSPLLPLAIGAASARGSMPVDVLPVGRHCTQAAWNRALLGE